MEILYVIILKCCVIYTYSNINMAKKNKSSLYRIHFVYVFTGFIIYPTWSIIVMLSSFCTYRPDHLERRWYQNQQQRQTNGGGGRMIRGLGGTKHLSEVYDDDDLLRLQQDDATVSALLLDDVVLSGGYNGRNSVSVVQRPLAGHTTITVV